MSEAEIKITADAASAKREIAGFRKEYADLVGAIQKPINQIDAFRKVQEDAKKASTEFFAARTSVDQLKKAISEAGQPVKELDRELVKAERSLARATLAFDRQKAKVKEQRAELRAAGVDTRNLAAEQQRLQAALSVATGKGQADASITKALDQFGITKLRDLRGQLVGLQADYKRLTRAGVLSANERIAAEIQYKARVDQTKKAINELTQDQGADGGMASLTARLAAITAAAYTIQRLAGKFFSVADEMNTLEDRMRNAVPVYAEYERAQLRLEDVSRRVRIPIAQTTELFLGMNGPLKEAGYSAQTSARMVGALSAALVSNNVKGQQAEAVLNQISTGMQTGTIRGDAFRAVLMKLPSVVDALTKSLGVSRGELIRMAAAGELTTEKFVQGVTGEFDAIMALADNMRSTTEDARGTFMDSAARVVKAIDTITGASDAAVRELDELSKAMDRIAKDEFVMPWVDYLAANRATNGPLAIAQQAGFEALSLLYKSWSEDAQEELAEVAAAEEEAAARSEAAQESRLSAMRSYAADFMGIQKQLAIDFKKALDDQVSAQNKAKSALTKAQNETLATQKRYQDALTKLNSGAAGPASFGNAMRLRDASAAALGSGDVERAKKLAQEALKMLLDLAEAGENTYGFEGFIQELQGIEQAADKISVENAQQSFEEAREKTRLWKEDLDKLKDFSISPSIDDEALAAATKQMQDWAEQIGQTLDIAPRVLPPGMEEPVVNATINPTGVEPEAPPVEVSVELSSGPLAAVTRQIQEMVNLWSQMLTLQATVLAEPPTIPGYATGTRSAPPGMAWVGERGPELVQFRGGERVFPSAESLRIAQNIPAIPSPSQALLSAGAAPEFPHLGSINLSLGGTAYTVYADSGTADELRLAARKFGRTRT